MEVDPFEARLEFISLLGKLNASQHSIQKVGNFAMKNRKLHEDLYNCIIEELEQTKSLNTRMNIFYVLDSICHQSHKAGFTGYIDLIQKNLPKIIEYVTPSGPKGNVNVAGTKKILELWRARKLFSDSALDKVEKPLLSRELGANAPTVSDIGFTKDDILKRMDEDRERHKRIREEIWIRPSDEDPGAEFLQNWDDVSDLDDVDYEDMEAENEKYLPGYPWELEFDRFLPSPAIFKLKPALSAKLMESVFSDTASSNNNSINSRNSAPAAKRLASPEGTVSMAGSSVNSRQSGTMPAPVPTPIAPAMVAPALPIAPTPPPPPSIPQSASSSTTGTDATGGTSGHLTKSNYYSSHEYRDHHSSAHSHHNQHPPNSYSSATSNNSTSHHLHYSNHQTHHSYHHQQQQQQHYHGSNSNNTSNSSSNNASHSRNHSSHSSHYDQSIPTGPAADTASASTAATTTIASMNSTSSTSSSRRASPSTSSSYHPYSRSHYHHERANSNNSAHSGYANGRSDHTSL
ncbi:hypothetical protein FBU30_005112 [Linnemannia zychae]|nr:hypothetical protein FBU30_005112 [Linnemannia zychae]